MELAIVVACVSLTALALTVAVFSESLRRRALRFERRLFAERERDMRLAARSFIAASRESPRAVIQVLDGIVRSTAPELDAFLFLVRDDATLACTYVSGMRAEYFLNARIEIDDIRSPISAAATRAHRIGRPSGLPPAIPGDRAFLAVPLVDAGRPLAVFYVGTRAADVLPSEETLVTLADLALPAYRLSEEHAIDRERAMIDALTGLLTPRAFRAGLTDRLARAQGNPQAKLALLFFDTDNFKACNDTLGHAAGDIVLRTLANILATSVGQDALVGRNGGDEFCILIESCTKAAAIYHADAIRRRVATHPYSRLFGDGTLKLPITASIGVATYPNDARVSNALLELADAAMYFSKRRGRNRVAFYGTDGVIADLGDDGFPDDRTAAGQA